MNSRTMLGVASLTTLVGGTIGYSLLDTTSAEAIDPPAPQLTSGPSRARALAAAYEKWEQAYEAAGGDRGRVMTLRRPAGHGVARTGTWGQVKLDLVEGRVISGVFQAKEPLDLWVVDNVPGEGRSSRPEPGDNMAWVGTLTPTEGGWARIEGTIPVGMPVDLAVMTRAGTSPVEGTELVAYANLFQRLHDQRQGAIAALSPRAPDGTLLDVLGPRGAAAVTGGSPLPQPSFEDLIEFGEFLFVDETFEGNGRTCASCHPPLNNFTLDEKFISKLPDDDPLFIAEFDAELADLEDPELMREFALIKENQDGVDDLENKFNMRGVPHTLALPTSLDVSYVDDGSFVEAIGWGGDGAPGGAEDGALRQFANGAIFQHATKTLDRVEGVDFRLATDEELDAMEAFQLSLGRQEDPDLATMVLKNPTAEAGRVLFTGFEVKCFFCHNNAGATDIGQHPFGDDQRIAAGNLNLNTGVENLPMDTSLGRRPRDGGFGGVFDQQTPLNPLFDADGNGVVDFPANPIFGCSEEPTTSGGFGDGTFNITTVVEAADTPPFFHNNAVATLEEAVAFYTTAQFNCSPAGRAVGGIAMTPEQIAQVTAFLRVINVLENVRSSDAFLSDALTERHLGAARPKLEAALADMQDGVEVLSEGKLHVRDASREIQNALVHVKSATKVTNATARNVLIKRAQASLARAKTLMEQ